MTFQAKLVQLSKTYAEYSPSMSEIKPQHVPPHSPHGAFCLSSPANPILALKISSQALIWSSDNILRLDSICCFQGFQARRRLPICVPWYTDCMAGCHAEDWTKSSRCVENAHIWHAVVDMGQTPDCLLPLLQDTGNVTCNLAYLRG